jgi:hypothetical protein
MRFTSGSWKKLLFVAISGISLLPASAVAEDARGKFTLGREVRWGVAVLPAGAYSYSVDYAASTVVLRSLNGGPSAIVLASSMSILDSSTTPRLMLKRQGNDWIVTSMVIGGDEELYFAPSSSNRSLREAKRPTKVAVLSTTATP